MKARMIGAIASLIVLSACSASGTNGLRNLMSGNLDLA